MLRTILCTTLLLAGASVAQTEPPKTTSQEPGQRFRIATTSDVRTERSFGGETAERPGRGGGAGQRKTETIVEFEERPSGEGAVERVYSTVTVTATPEEGEAQKIEGEIVGKKLVLGGGEEPTAELDGEELPRMAARRVPAAMTFEGLIPADDAETGTEYDVGGAIGALLGRLDHSFAAQPQRPARAPGGRPEQGEGERPRSGRGADEGAGERRRGAANFRGAWAARDPIFSVLSQVKVEPKATASVAEIDDHGVATVRLTGTMAAEGTPDELGLGMAGRFGGRRGPGAGEDAPQGSAELDVEFEGVLRVDTRSDRVLSLVLDGRMASSSDISMRRRGGEPVEMTSSSDGTFRIEISTVASGTADAKSEKKSD